MYSSDLFMEKFGHLSPQQQGSVLIDLINTAASDYYYKSDNLCNGLLFALDGLYEDNKERLSKLVEGIVNDEEYDYENSIWIQPKKPLPFRYGYGKVIKTVDKAMVDFFSNFQVFDENDKAKPVPVCFVLNEQEMPYKETQCFIIKKDFIPGNPQPFGLSSPWKLNYQVCIKTILMEEMNQICEQVIMNFPHVQIESDYGLLPLQLNNMGNKVGEMIKPWSGQSVKVYRCEMEVSVELPQL